MTIIEQLLATTFLGATLLRWLLAVVAGVGAFMLLQFVRGRLKSRLRTREGRRTFRLDHLLLSLIGATRTWALLAISVYLVILLLGIDPVTTLRLQQAFTILLFLQVALWGNSAIGFFAEQYSRSEDLDSGRRTTLAAMTFVGRLVLYSLLILLVLDNLGIDVTALIAGLGVGSVAVALAVQGILSDLFASLSIVFDKPFEIGDFIVVDDMFGTVEHIGLRTTRVRSLSGEQLVFANNDLLASRIRNYKRMAERRVLFSVGVEYGTPREALERIPQLIREIIEELPNTRFDRSHFSAFGAYSLDFETVYYVLTADYNEYMDTQQRLNLELYRRVQELGVQFAFPTQTIDLRPGAPERRPQQA